MLKSKEEWWVETIWGVFHVKTQDSKGGKYKMNNK